MQIPNWTAYHHFNFWKLKILHAIFFFQWAATERFAPSRSIAREAVGKTFLKIDHFVASIILRKASYEALAARGDSASLRACRRKSFLAFGGGRSGQLHSPSISPFPL